MDNCLDGICTGRRLREAARGRRRVEVSVQKPRRLARKIWREYCVVGLLKDRIDRTVQLHLAGTGEGDPHLIFLCTLTDG